MNDPLSEVIALLQPRAVFAKRISGARIQFRPEDASTNPDFEIEDVQNQRTVR